MFLKFKFQGQADPVRSPEGAVGREVGVADQRVRTKLGDVEPTEEDLGG
jgi:hypothetical protein